MKRCICIYPTGAAFKGWLERVNAPRCPRHGGTGKWEVIPVK